MVVPRRGRASTPPSMPSPPPHGHSQPPRSSGSAAARIWQHRNPALPATSVAVPLPPCVASQACHHQQIQLLALWLEYIQPSGELQRGAITPTPTGKPKQKKI